jgi:hypothetical protein
MNIDAFSFILGALAVILLGFMFMARKSYFDQSPFQDTMSEVEARQVMDNMTQDLKQKFETKTSPSEAEVKEFQDSLVKLTSDFSAFMTRKSFQAPAPEVVMQAPAPSPEVVMQAPAPSPEMAAPMAPAVSMYEPQPY